MTAKVWKVIQNANILTTHAFSTTEGNFYDGYGKAMILARVQDYNRHMQSVGKSDHMMNSYSIKRQTWQRTKTLFFHLLDLTILNSFIIFSSYASKLSHRQFRLTLVRDLIQEVRRVPQPQIARQAPSTSQLKIFNSRHNRHWLMQCKRI